MHLRYLASTPSTFDRKGRWRRQSFQLVVARCNLFSSMILRLYWRVIHETAKWQWARLNGGACSHFAIVLIGVSVIAIAASPARGSEFVSCSSAPQSVRVAASDAIHRLLFIEEGTKRVMLAQSGSYLVSPITVWGKSVYLVSRSDFASQRGYRTFDMWLWLDVRHVVNKPDEFVVDLISRVYTGQRVVGGSYGASERAGSYHYKRVDSAIWLIGMSETPIECAPDSFRPTDQKGILRVDVLDGERLHLEGKPVSKGRLRYQLNRMLMPGVASGWRMEIYYPPTAPSAAEYARSDVLATGCFRKVEMILTPNASTEKKSPDKRCMNGSSSSTPQQPSCNHCGVWQHDQRNKTRCWQNNGCEK